VTVTLRGHEFDGVVREGESWSAAARRTCAAAHDVPEPVDLSGDVKRFVIDHDTRVTVRAMTRGDLEAMTRWRQASHVRRWWDTDGEPTSENVERKYGPDIDGITPTRLWVGEVNGRAIGFVQDYRIRDYPDYALLTPDPDAVGVDYAVGEPGWTSRGFGTRMLWAWMHRARHRFPDARTFFAAPDHRNAASLRMLAKTGFVAGTWFDEPQEDGSTTTVVGCRLDVERVIG
jgi:aminoglycoside 6'-N-acetyltransferase